MKYLSLSTPDNLIGWARTLITQLTQRDGLFGTMSTQNANNVNITGGKITAPFTVASLPTYASDSAAGTGGLTAGSLYKTSTGQVMVKL